MPGFGWPVILLAAVTLCPPAVWASDPEWQPGIIGGIPYVQVVHSVTDFGATGDLLHDDAPAFQAALDALVSDGGAVFVPPGKYLLRSQLRLRSGAVLRGGGAADTHLYFDFRGNTDNAIEAFAGGGGQWVAATGGLSMGSSYLRVADATGFEVPSFAEIEQENDPDLMYTDPLWNQPEAQGAVGEIVRVVGKDGNLLVLEHPLHYSYDPGQNPRVSPRPMVERVGVEDLHVERVDGGAGGIIFFKNAAWSWIRGVESKMASRFHVSMESSYRCEVRSSFFHLAHYYGGGGFGHGVSLIRHTTSCLVEDNIFSELRHAMIISLGVNGCVFGYNYSRVPICDQCSDPADISLHGWYPFQNLYEGNVADELVISDYWGPAGPGNTVFRNCIRPEGIAVLDHSHGQSVIGNYLPAAPGNLVFVDPTVEGTIVHGNLVGDTIQWDPNNPDHTLADSMYLDARPSYFGALDWPPIGGDRGPFCTNPAFERWEKGEAVPAATVGPRIRSVGGDRRVAPQ